MIFKNVSQRLAIFRDVSDPKKADSEKRLWYNGHREQKNKYISKEKNLYQHVPKIQNNTISHNCLQNVQAQNFYDSTMNIHQIF